MKFFLSIAIAFLLLIPLSLVKAQGNFHLPAGVKNDKIPVEIVNNLIIVPVTVNGTELSFLLDTGADATILFQIEKNQSIILKDATYSKITGAGKGDPVQALRSNGNKIQIGKAQSTDQTMFAILDEELDFSPQLGIPVQGIIGYQLFKDFIVEFNYPKEYIRLHDPRTFTSPKCKSCSELPLSFTKNKALVASEVTIQQNTSKVKLLLDSGMGDAAWLFINEESDIPLPEKKYYDFLGLGLNGGIYGNRGIVNQMEVGRFTMKNITTSFPDSLSIKNILLAEDRNGSIGAEFLRRFHCTVDYPNKKLHLKKNRYYGAPFNYNKSGITVQHGNYTIDRELLKSNDNRFSQVNEYTNQIVNLFSASNTYRTVLHPTYEIAEIRPNSPAQEAGLEKGDLIIKINGRATKKMTLQKLMENFFQESGKRVSLTIERDGIEILKTVTLQSLL